MKKILFISWLLIPTAAFPQFYSTSFEEPEVFTIQYTDTGDANVAHDLLNNTGEPFVDFPETNGELGYNARYEPYDTPSDGLTDGDLVGVTDLVGTVGAYTDGLQGYQVSDVDGNYILEFDVITSTSTGPSMSIDYFIAETGYEGDGTVNESGSDRLRIYVKDLTNNTEFDIFDSTGSNINSLGIEGSWITGSVGLTPFNSSPIDFQLVIEARNNAGNEAFFFDNVVFDGFLGIDQAGSNVITVYPNPAAEGFVNITSNKNGAVNVQVFDVLGKLVINALNTNERLDISKLNSGVYIMKIYQEGVSQIQKLIVR